MTQSLSRRRPVALLLLPLAVVAGALVSNGTARATSATPAASAHTGSARAYSDPVYYPLRDPAMVGCITSNCPHADHKGFAINLDSNTSDSNRNNVGVYAMGSGILHVGTTHPVACGQSSHAGVGNWVWVDHGGGVVSEYLHLQLGSITVPGGSFVSAGERIGTMGNTGDSHCGVNYLDFSVRHGGIHGNTVTISTLTACRNGSAVSYPHAVARASTWSDVAYKTQITTATTSGCIPSSFTSPTKPGHVTAKGHHHSATVSWAAASGVSGIQVQSELYHSSTGGYSYPTYLSVSRNATSTTVAGLKAKGRYRFRVSFHNHSGWSHPSGWVSATAH